MKNQGDKTISAHGLQMKPKELEVMAPFLDFCYYRRFSSPHGKKIKTVVELAEDERPSDGRHHS